MSSLLARRQPQPGTAQHSMARHSVPVPAPSVSTPFLPPHGGHGEENAARKLQPHCWGRKPGGNPGKDMVGPEPRSPEGRPEPDTPQARDGDRDPQHQAGTESPCPRVPGAPPPPVPTASPSPASPPSPARYPRTLRPVSPAPPAAAPASPVLLLLRPHPVPRISRCLPPLPRPGPTAPPSRTVPVLPGAPARSWPRNSSGAAPSAPVGGAAGAGGSRSRSRSRSLPVGVAGAPRSRRARPHLPRSAHRPQPPVPGAPLPPCRSEAAPVPPYRAPAWPGPSPRCGSAPGARLGPAGTCPAAPGGNTGVPHQRGCRTGARRGLEGGRPRTGRGGTAGSPPGHRCDEPGGLSPALLNAAHQEIPSGDKGRSSRVCVTHTGSSTSGGLWGGSREWRSQPHRVRITGLEGPPAGMSADG